MLHDPNNASNAVLSFVEKSQRSSHMENCEVSNFPAGHWCFTEKSFCYYFLHVCVCVCTSTPTK